VGQTPELRVVSKRRVLSTFVALTVTGKIYKKHFTHSIKGEDVVTALRHIQRFIPGKIIIIWDGLRAHRGPAVKDYCAQHPEIMIEPLPSYAPDLNPEEQCHGNVKRHLQNATPANIDQLRKQVDNGFARLRNRPDLLQSFFRHSGFRVNFLC
jgi:transposase